MKQLNSFGIMLAFFMVMLVTIEAFNIQKMLLKGKPKSTTATAKKNSAAKPAQKLVGVRKQSFVKWIKPQKPVANIHLLSIRLLSKLMSKLGDQRSRSVVNNLLIKNCPNINLFSRFRQEIINCRVLSANMKEGSETQKNLNIGCLKNIIDHVAAACPSVMRKSPANFFISRAVFNLNKIKTQILPKFQILGRVAIKRLAIMMKVFPSLIKAKLAKIRAVLNKKKLAANRKVSKSNSKKSAAKKTASASKKGKKSSAPKPKKSAAPARAKKTAAPAKTKKKSAPAKTKAPSNKSASRKGKPLKPEEKLPKNTKNEIKLIKLIKITQLKNMTLSSFLAKTIKKIAETQ